MREKYPRIGKEKLEPLLDAYCMERGIKPVSESTIGNIIKTHKLFYQKTYRIYHNPNSKWAENRAKRQKRSKIRHPIKPEDFGHIVSDTLQRITEGVKDYFYSAIDERNMKDFYERFKSVYPLRIKSWQKDNGA